MIFIGGAGADTLDGGTFGDSVSCITASGIHRELRWAWIAGGGAAAVATQPVMRSSPIERRGEHQFQRYADGRQRRGPIPRRRRW